MNIFDIVLIICLVVVVLFGLILGLNKGSRFLFAVYGATAMSILTFTPVMNLINTQDWFINLSKVFLGFNGLNIAMYCGLCGLSWIIFYFLFHLILKFLGAVMSEERVASHVGGLLLGTLNCVLLLFAVLLVFDFVKDKVDVSHLDYVYNSFTYSFLRPAVSSLNGIGGK